ncbi:MAG TPA: Ni/Fe hydrogenase subunit alpha [Cyanobacteria bacterium UBA8530]|nr:Ni/Fe hydrogenase subunit alpha [Cyanobacteria bacterium UBA8530]
MGADLKIDIDLLTRVEGHGNIVVNVEEGTIRTCEFRVVESPRFFEAMLKGRSIFEAQHLSTRICGICAVGHNMAYLKAAEEAMRITPSEQTVLLRKIMLHAEIFDSHVLHINVLVAPDLLGIKSILPLVATRNDLVRRALRLKRMPNAVTEILAGRKVHPISPVAGGFTKLPTRADLEKIRELLIAARPDLEETISLFQTLEFPSFERETEYIGLTQPGEYPFYEGTITSSLGKTYRNDQYLEMTNEYVVPQSTAKRAKANQESYMVGALARFNLNHSFLHPNALQAAEALGLKAPCFNPFLNTAAQLVECVQALEDSVELVDLLLSRGIKHEAPVAEVKAGRGIGAVEVPRGLLFHDYTVGADGLTTAVNCVIPTNQNTANIDFDLKALLPQILDRPREEITLLLEMLVRAYDPCISCSSHLVEISFA